MSQFEIFAALALVLYGTRFFGASTFTNPANLFRTDKSRAMSLSRKIKTAAYNPAYLAAALHLPEI